MLLLLGSVRFEKGSDGVDGGRWGVGIQWQTDLRTALSPLMQERPWGVVSPIAAKSHHLKTFGRKSFLPPLDPETFP
jgi:hypothetical protein